MEPLRKHIKSNMKKHLLLAISLMPLFMFAQNSTETIDYTKFVNPFIGTGSIDSLSLSGSNFPGACIPFGLVQLRPYTLAYPDDPCRVYEYKDQTII